MSGTATEWHVLGLSGGRDSAALAVHMRRTIPNSISTISSPTPARNCRKSTSSWSSSRDF